jgi:hypothetical protein
VPNLVTVKVGAGGAVVLRNASSGSSDLVADVAGYYVAGTPTQPGTFVSLSPARVLDTRVGNGAPVGAVAAGGQVSVVVAGRGGVPLSGVSAVVLNVTVTGTKAAGVVTVFPAGEALPLASNLNFVKGQTVPNLVTVKVGAGGAVVLRNASSGSSDLVADLAGYFMS